ncbi:hypothetical protein [Streptomyces sp. NPDC059076]|uniref:hypothetical protein n=1 Tax=unclassified Streptomyces TaxID=2593676 RepID=UPI0036CAADB5
MSIYASLPGINDEHPTGPPWIYQGSHILPTTQDPRGGDIDLAVIPSHITRDGRDDQPDDGAPWPWLRFTLDTGSTAATAVLDPAQARDLAAQMTAWADTVHPQAERLPYDALRERLNLLETGRRERSALLEEARDALENAGINEAQGGESWPRLVPAIEELAAARDLAEATLAQLHGRLEQAEAALERVRRFCEVTVAVSVRVEAVAQARDTLVAIDQAKGFELASCDDAMHVGYDTAGGCVHGPAGI